MSEPARTGTDPSEWRSSRTASDPVRRLRDYFAGDLAALLKQEIKDEIAEEKKEAMKDDPAEPAPADDATATLPPVFTRFPLTVTAPVFITLSVPPSESPDTLRLPTAPT